VVTSGTASPFFTSPLEGEVDQRPLTGANREGGIRQHEGEKYPPPQPSPARGEGARRASGTADEQCAWAIAAQVVDPEVPVLTVEDLGVLRDVKIENGRVEVFITPTYSGCPATYVIALNIEAALEDAGFGLAKITTVLSPPWTTAWMTEAGRAKLKAYGIAPPNAAAGRRALFGEEQVACPRCGSADTSRISEFGSTACKALWRCRACAEPFDYFKCI
jgi:ring-1,2-phenylacetyl-CoA epoxidase subunit PaaD